METFSVSSPYFLTFLAALVKLGDKGFLSLSLSRLHCPGPDPEQERRAPPLPPQPVEETGAEPRPLQPDRQLRRGTERDQHKDQRPSPVRLLCRGAGSVRQRRPEVRRHHRP